MKLPNGVRMYDCGEKELAPGYHDPMTGSAVVQRRVRRVMVCVDPFDRFGNVYELWESVEDPGFRMRRNLPPDQAAPWMTSYLTERLIDATQTLERTIEHMTRALGKRKRPRKHLRRKAKWGRP